MACVAPKKAWRPKPDAPTRRLVFDPRKAGDYPPIKVPCGQCVNCRLEHSRQWAMRILHEKMLHHESSFLTLTYSREWLPDLGFLVKEDLQKFMKRLHHHRGKLRYFGCGEYGDENKRPHYHVVLMNVDFPDKKFYSQNGNGDVYYTSEFVRELWPFGNNIIGELNFRTAAYVARYCLKKITGRDADRHYEVYDADGQIHRRPTEFVVMSRRPGLANGHYERFGQSIRDHDSVIINGRAVSPPRYYDNLYKAIDEQAFELLKLRRRRKAALNLADNTKARLRVKEVLALQRLSKLRRNV